MHFRVYAEPGNPADYAPAIVARRGSILFLVEPIPSGRHRALIARLARFLEQHSPEIVLAVVATDATVRKILPEAYDEIYAKADIARLTARIRTQDPEGIVRPFEKLHVRDPSG